MIIMSVASCSIDNYDAPNATLSGKVIDNVTNDMIENGGVNTGTVIQIFEGDSKQPILSNSFPDGHFVNAALFTESRPYLVTVSSTGYENSTVVQPITPAVNLALNKQTSTSEPARQDAQFAVDGSKSTRWESPFSDPQWISVDLGDTLSISRVLLNWENASAKAYTIEVSTDGVNWTTVYSTTDGNEGIYNILFNPIDARYVKVNGTERNKQYGYSLFEMEVYE